jgi:hypothetical protein
VTFAQSRPPIWGVAVVVPRTGASFTQNADEQVPTASTVKVLVMFVVLERARQEGRPVTESELALLWPMITASDNDSTSALWEDIGRGQAVGSYLRSIGVSGFTPDPGLSWGVSFASARAMATALAKLVGGEILDEPSRALAFKLLDAVIPEQRWGITAGVDPQDAVDTKNGWYPGEEGWRVNSVGVVRPRGGDPYAIAVMTDGRASCDALSGLRRGISSLDCGSDAQTRFRRRGEQCPSPPRLKTAPYSGGSRRRHGAPAAQTCTPNMSPKSRRLASDCWRGCASRCSAHSSFYSGRSSSRRIALTGPGSSSSSVEGS